MFLTNLKNRKKIPKNYNTIHRQLTEYSTPSPTYPFQNHLLEDHSLFYYHNIHKKAKESSASFHGYMPLCSLDLVFNTKSLYGTIFVLDNHEDFIHLQKEKIELKNNLPLDAFTSELKNAPLPFLFLSKCELYDFRDFMNELSSGGDNELKVYESKSVECGIMMMEPVVLAKCDLDYLVMDVMDDERICSLLYGFMRVY